MGRVLMCFLSFVLLSVAIAENPNFNEEDDTCSLLQGGFKNLKVTSRHVSSIRDDPPDLHLRSSTQCNLYPSLHQSDLVGLPPLTGKFRKEVEVVNASDLTAELFMQRYVIPNKPVIVAGGAYDMFSQVTAAMSPESLSGNKFANIKLPVTHTGRGYKPYQDYLKVDEIFAREDRTIHLLPLEFSELNGHLSPNSSKLLQQDAYKNMTTNWNEWAEHNGFSKFSILLANQGGLMPHHHNSTVNVMTYGAKRWFLADPQEFNSEDEQKTLEYKREEQLAESRSREYRSTQWWRDQVPQMDRPYYDFIQEQGDALFVPNGFTHATIAMCKDTIAAVFLRIK